MNNIIIGISDYLLKLEPHQKMSQEHEKDLTSVQYKPLQLHSR